LTYILLQPEGLIAASGDGTFVLGKHLYMESFITRAGKARQVSYVLFSSNLLLVVLYLFTLSFLSPWLGNTGSRTRTSNVNNVKWKEPGKLLE